MWEKFDGIRYSVSFGDGVIAGIIPIVFWGWAYIVSEGSTISPGESVASAVMDDDLAARGSKWCFIKVEVTMDEGMCR